MKISPLTYINDALTEHQDHLILWIPVFLGCGAAWYFGMGTEPAFRTLLAVQGLLALLFAVLYWRVHHTENPDRLYVASLVAALAFWVCAGLVLAKLETQSSYTPLMADRERIALVHGSLEHIEATEDGRGKAIVLEQLELENWAPDQIPRKIRLILKGKQAQPEIHLGDRIEVLVKLHAPNRPVMPGAFDFQRFYFFQQIGATGFALRPPVVLEPGDPDAVEFMLSRIRGKIADKVEAVLEPRTSGIAVALMTGDRAAISEGDWNALRASGLAHIISISGLHVALVAAPVFFLIRLFMAAIPYLALRWPIKKIAACIALIACIAYVALVVPSVPTYRALLMTGIGLLAIMLDRSPFSMRLVAFAAAIVLIFSPQSIWSASFQMSFAAVTALVAVADWLRPYWGSYLRNGGWGRKIVVYCVASIITSIVATLATSPFSSFHFQQIATYSVVANTLAVPLTGLIIMPMMILSFILLPLGLEALPLHYMGLGIGWMLDLAVAVSEWPGSVWKTSAWPMHTLVLLVIAGLCLTLMVGRYRLMAAPLLMGSILSLAFVDKPDMVISEAGALVLVRDKQDQAYISSLKKEKFAAGIWFKRLNLDPKAVKLLPQEGQIRSGNGLEINCDAEVCRYVVGDTKISFGKNLYAIRQECDWADLIFVPDKKMKSCGKVKVIDRWKFKDMGAISLSNGQMETVRNEQGQRPWTNWPTYKKINDKTGSKTTAHPEFVPDQD